MDEKRLQEIEAYVTEARDGDGEPLRKADHSLWWDRGDGPAAMRDLVAEVRRLRADAVRYQAQFTAGQWDYHDNWISQPKSVVDRLIDETLTPTVSAPPA